jgi:hypothetical protein
MSLNTRLHCSSETERPQLLDDVSHVVVEVTTNDYRSIGVLFDDVPHHFCHSLCYLLQVLLLSRLEIAVQNLDIVVAELQLAPAEIRPKCLHQLQVGVGSRCVPTSSAASMHGLERPEATQEEWGLQLGLTEADHLRSVVSQEIVDDLLFGLLVQKSNIEGDESELLSVKFQFREISLDPRSVSVGECISSVISVVRSIPTVPLIFALGLLLPRCNLVFHTFGGSSPTVITGFRLGHLTLLPQLLDSCPFLHLKRLTGCSWYSGGQYQLSHAI